MAKGVIEYYDSMSESRDKGTKAERVMKGLERYASVSHDCSHCTIAFTCPPMCAEQACTSDR
eukprot:6117306-Pyramimonas_sp.AAC.1